MGQGAVCPDPRRRRHFLSQGAEPLHFGLGRAGMVGQITVQWRSGRTQILNYPSKPADYLTESE
ncbi:MAG: ASPIC/UnbV domain-containing protein [Chthoniobacterales bacterium]|nr:ASPIC/UnbV domain-containing protein [Chthoniobacterales bacterium]